MINKKAMQYVMAKRCIEHENIKIIVTSGCMMPLVEVNDVIEIKGCEDYCMGDIVAIYVDGEIRLHRIVRMTKSSVQTKGDLAYQLDCEAEWSKIIGLAVRNCTKEFDIQREKACNKKIAEISYEAAQLYIEMQFASNHINLKKIAMLHNEVQKLSALCIKQKESLEEAVMRMGSE